MLQTPDPAFTAGEIADEFDKTRQWGHNKLTDLERDGFVKSKNPGGNARFYWVTATGKEFLRDTRQSDGGQ